MNSINFNYEPFAGNHKSSHGATHMTAQTKCQHIKSSAPHNERTTLQHSHRKQCIPICFPVSYILGHFTLTILRLHSLTHAQDWASSALTTIIQIRRYDRARSPKIPRTTQKNFKHWNTSLNKQSLLESSGTSPSSRGLGVHSFFPVTYEGFPKQKAMCNHHSDFI